jgi:hypothetical protein
MDAEVIREVGKIVAVLASIGLLAFVIARIPR